MIDLTEKWKKGELLEGWYYIKDENGVIYAAENCLNYDSLSDKGYTSFYYAETEISEVIASVPSYYEWVYLHKARNDAHEIVESLTKENKQLRKRCEEFNALDVAKENKQLKKLLHQCKYELIGRYTDVGEEDYSLITKIDNAIGEK